MRVTIKRVNHGKAFGKDNWYTFYCGSCGRQVMGTDRQCENCKALLTRQDK